MDTVDAAPETHMPVAEPQEQHAWLQKLVGEWTWEHDGPGKPGEAPSKITGTETVRSLGGLWIVGEGSCTMPDGGTAQMMLTLGYDPRQQRFVGTWVGSMMTYLWVYDGELDEAGRVLTLNAEGPNCSASGALAPFKDRIEFITDDHRTLTSQTVDENGNWQTFMTAHYYRKK